MNYSVIQIFSYHYEMNSSYILFPATKKWRKTTHILIKVSAKISCWIDTMYSSKMYGSNQNRVHCWVAMYVLFKNSVLEWISQSNYWVDFSLNLIFVIISMIKWNVYHGDFCFFFKLIARYRVTFLLYVNF